MIIFKHNFLNIRTNHHGLFRRKVLKYLKVSGKLDMLMETRQMQREIVLKNLYRK